MLIDGVQLQATKLVPEFKELTYGERLEKMQLPSLYYRRVRYAIMPKTCMDITLSSTRLCHQKMKYLPLEVDPTS